MGSCFSESCELTNEDGQISPLLKSEEPEFQNSKNIEGAPNDKKWYHACISDEEAERRLRVGSGGNNGSYVVYDNPRKRGQYILLVINNNKFYRWKISLRTSDNRYILGDDGPGVVGYASVRELIKSHRGVRGKPLKTNEGKTMTLSKSYVYVDN